jgi:hypothetical protein
MPREPWIKIKIGIRRSGKMAALPTDTARLGWFYVLVEAKVQRHLGVFDNKAHFVEVMGRFGKYLDAYQAAGLLHVAPDLCRECKPRHRDAKRGQVIVHDYLREQRDPTNADRQANYRETHGDEDEGPDGDAEVTPTVTPAITAEVTPTVTPEQGATVTPDSRARATTATVTSTAIEIEGSPDVVYPANGAGTRSIKGFTTIGDVVETLAEQSQDWTQALTLSERDEWSSFGPDWDAFRAAWLKRGFRHPPAGNADDDPDATSPSQRALLWSILDAWPNELPRWVAEAPKKSSASQVVGYLKDRFHGKRDEGNDRADADEAGPTWLTGSPEPAEAKP